MDYFIEQKRLLEKPLIIGVVLILVVISFYVFLRNNSSDSSTQDTPSPINAEIPPTADQPTSSLEVSRRVSFTQFNPIYRFSGVIPNHWEVTYIPQIQAINIYDSTLSSENTTEQSQILIRSFSANNFLTLSTVDITVRNPMEVKGHEAVEYEIIKKPGVRDFPHAPAWRNTTHRSIDVRFSKSNPSTFYTIAYNPGLDRRVYDAFIDSLLFHNDINSFEPILT